MLKGKKSNLWIVAMFASIAVIAWILAYMISWDKVTSLPLRIVLLVCMVIAFAIARANL